MTVITLAWIAVTFEMAGNWLVGDKLRWGFLVKIIGSACWLAVAVLCGINGLTVSAILGGIISTRNWLRWRKG